MSAAPFILSDVRDAELCAHCGARAGKHRGTDGKCPGKQYPSFVAAFTPEWQAQADAFWGERSTHFKR